VHYYLVVAASLRSTAAPRRVSKRLWS